MGGTLLLATLSVSGTAAAAALPSIAKPHVTVASTGSLVSAGSVFHVSVGYRCAARSSTNVSLEAHQNVGGGFVANGYGYGRTAAVCDGRTHVYRVTVVPTGDRGFRAGPAFVIADVTSCTADAKTCMSATTERSLTVR